jgi:outer membrane receptor protein involved in Fe transport
MRNTDLGAAGVMRAALSIAALLLLLPARGQAQALGAVRGKVTRADAGDALAGVTVTVRGTGIAGVTGPDGIYHLERVPPGSQTILFRWLGYRPQEAKATVTAGGTTTVDAVLQAQPIALQEVVVTASRTPEREVDAPAAVSIAEVTEVRTAAVTGQLPRVVANVPGVDLVQSGVTDFNINARGFNSSLNRRVLVLQDGRDLSVAFLGAQEWGSNPPLEDGARVELVRGPGSALYGANAFSGVLSVTTPAARDIQGTRISISGGELGSLKADLRHAGVLSQGRFGYKIAGGYATSDTWSRSRTLNDGSDFTAEYAAATTEGVKFPPFGIEKRPMNGQTFSDTATGAITGNRDPIVDVFGDGRLDYYALNGSLATVEGGAGQVQNELFVTGIGRVQVTKALRPWARAAWAAKNYNLMAWYSGRESRQPQYSLASGLPLDEHSAIYHVEGQYNRAFLQDKARIVLGASFRRQHVNTDSTLMMGVNDDRNDNLYAGYGQLEYSLTPQVRLVGAARYDDGDLIDAQFSPKGAIVFSPTDQHSLRFTFNQAFQTPAYSEFFLRVPVATPQAGPRTLERGVETLFQQMNGGPLGPAVASLNLPNSLPWNFDSLTQVLALGNSSLKVEKVTGWELGYKGNFSNQGYVTIDGYINRLKNFVTDLLPAVNPTYPRYSLTDSVNVQNKLDSLDLRIQALQQGGQISPTLAAQIRSNIAVLRGGYVQLAGGLGPLLATIGSGTRAGVVSYTNAGEVTERGIEVGAGYYLTNEIKLEGSYTFFDFDVTKQGQPGDSLLPNTPKHKGTFAASYRGHQGVEASVSTRVVDAFNWAAGVYAGHIPAAQVLDVNLGYRVNNYVRLLVVGTNVLDQKRFSIYGGSVNGRRVLGGVTATF